MYNNVLNFSLSFIKKKEEKKKEKLLNQIFEKYYDRIYRFFLYRTNNVYLSEELSSMVFEKIIINIDSYDKSSSIEPWIFTISRNCLYDYFKSRKNKTFLDIDDFDNILVSKSDVENHMLSCEDNQALLKALNKLNPIEQNIVSYKFGAELKNKEIAQILKLSETNVGTILYRSIKKLKTIMESDKYER